MSSVDMDMVSELGDGRKEDGESNVASMRNVIKAQHMLINELQERVGTLETQNEQLAKENKRTRMLEDENRELNRKIKKLRKKLDGRRRRVEFGGREEEESGSQVVVKEEPNDDDVSHDDNRGNGSSRPSTSSGGRSLSGNTGERCKPCSVVLTRLSLEEIAKVRKSLVQKPTALKPKKTDARKMSKVGISTPGKKHRLVIIRQWVKDHPRQKGYFKCSCGMDFRFKNTATSHVWRKNNSIPNFFKCNKCAKTFDYNSVLKRHYRDVHKLEFKWGKVVCGICGLETLDSYKELWKHRLEVHGLRHGCRNNI